MIICYTGYKNLLYIPPKIPHTSKYCYFIAYVELNLLSQNTYVMELDRKALNMYAAPPQSNVEQTSIIKFLSEAETLSRLRYILRQIGGGRQPTISTGQLFNSARLFNVARAQTCQCFRAPQNPSPRAQGGPLARKGL